MLIFKTLEASVNVAATRGEILDAIREAAQGAYGQSQRTLVELLAVGSKMPINVLRMRTYAALDAMGMQNTIDGIEVSDE